jgi:hypothetical protein
MSRVRARVVRDWESVPRPVGAVPAAKGLERSRSVKETVVGGAKVRARPRVRVKPSVESSAPRAIVWPPRSAAAGERWAVEVEGDVNE